MASSGPFSIVWICLYNEKKNLLPFFYSIRPSSAFLTLVQFLSVSGVPFLRKEVELWRGKGGASRNRWKGSNERVNVDLSPSLIIFLKCPLSFFYSVKSAYVKQVTSALTFLKVLFSFFLKQRRTDWTASIAYARQCKDQVSLGISSSQLIFAISSLMVVLYGTFSLSLSILPTDRSFLLFILLVERTRLSQMWYTPSSSLKSSIL